MTASSAQILYRAGCEIAGWVPLWTRLLVQHVPDPNGRCRACPSAVSVAPVWPCRIATLAAVARSVHEASPDSPA